jgi:hypothetical protein
MVVEGGCRSEAPPKDIQHHRERLKKPILCEFQVLPLRAMQKIFSPLKGKIRL